MTAGSIAISLGIAAGNALQVVSRAYLVNRFASGTYAFDHPKMCSNLYFWPQWSAR